MGKENKRRTSWGNILTVLLLSLIFTLSAIDKVLHFDGFTNALRDYVVVPRGMASYLAKPIIILELTIGIGLLLRHSRRLALLASAIMLCIFTIAVSLNYFYGNNGICGCWFTITLPQTTSAHMAQNAILFSLALISWWKIRRTEHPEMGTES